MNITEVTKKTPPKPPRKDIHREFVAFVQTFVRFVVLRTFLTGPCGMLRLWLWVCDRAVSHQPLALHLSLFAKIRHPTSYMALFWGIVFNALHTHFTPTRYPC